MNTSTSRRTAAPQNKKNSQKGSKLPLIVVAVIVIAVAVFAAVAINYANQNKYNWDNLKLENGRMVYYEKGDVASTTGIDVSDLQGSIDWEAVKDDGIDFAMLRCGRRGSTEGQLYTDTKYYENVEGATRAGLPHGVYFFSQATNEQEALEEAEYVLNLINGAGVTYPVVYDQEPVTDSSGRANNLSTEQLTKNAQTFCKRIEEAGYTPMVYGNQYDLSRLNIDQVNAAVWYAEYTDSHPTSSYHDFVMWQYSHTGKVNGISTSVDMDILFEADWISPER